MKAFLPTFFSPISRAGTIQSELDTYQIYAVGHISGPRTCDDKEAYHIAHLLCLPLDPHVLWALDYGPGKLLKIYPH